MTRKQQIIAREKHDKIRNVLIEYNNPEFADEDGNLHP